jgi:phosphatidylglycerophosphatase A
MPSTGSAGLAAWLAQAGPVGRMPGAPGTAGSLVGLLIGYLGGRFGTTWCLIAVSAAAFVVCVEICARAERELAQHDPPSVVLDEVWGMAAVLWWLPGVWASWVGMAAAFALFRAFDTLKPPPLRHLARLPGGWGIMADDLGASVYTGAILWVALRLAHAG